MTPSDATAMGTPSGPASPPHRGPVRLGAGLLILFLLFTGASAQTTEELLMAGQAGFRSNCMSCHQESGQGFPPVFPALAGNANLADERFVIDTVLTGRNAMPSFHAVDDDTLAAIVSYVRSSWGNDFGLVTAEVVAEVREGVVLGEVIPLSSFPAFTAAQSERGRRSYEAHCATCHGFDYEPDDFSQGLTGASFQWFWGGKTLLEYYETIRGRMPWGNANSLPPDTYLDIVAHLLDVNGFPVGDSELTLDPDLLSRLQIE